MAQRAVDVATVFKFLTEHNLMYKYDPKVVPLSFNSQEVDSDGKLRIGYFTSLADSPTLGDTPTMVLKAKAILELLGHTVIPFELTNVAEYSRILDNLEHADLGHHFKNKLKHEDISFSIQGFYDECKTPYWQRKLISFLPPALRFGCLQHTQYGMSVRHSSDLWDCIADRTVAVNQLVDELNELKLDLIISPAFATPALPLEVMKIRGGGEYRARPISNCITIL
jgi:Asp-tRNA(Asn)/Glu-tRNA(Gln) amidotransferase A subunit family amidase